MILDVAISEVQQMLGWRSDKVTEITSALRYAQDEREKPGRTFPWFLRTTATITTVVGQAEYSIPANYIQDTEEKEGNLFLYSDGTVTSRTVFLKKGDFESLQTKYYGTWPYTAGLSESLSDLANASVVGPGVPIDYCLRDTTVLLYPKPDAVYSLLWRYWGKADTLTIGAENAWLKYAPWVLIGQAARKIAADLEYSAGVDKASQVLATAEENLFRAIINREEAGRRRGMGSKL